MARTDTDSHHAATGTAPESGRTLMVIDGTATTRGPVSIPDRPRAEFLAQLLVSADPAMRSSRLERTRSAVAHYAETARRRA